MGWNLSIAVDDPESHRQIAAGEWHFIHKPTAAMRYALALAGSPASRGRAHPLDVPNGPVGALILQDRLKVIISEFFQVPEMYAEMCDANMLNEVWYVLAQVFTFIDKNIAKVIPIDDDGRQDITLAPIVTINFCT